MKQVLLNEGLLKKFQLFLLEEERSGLTIEKYMRDVRAFAEYLAGRAIERSIVLEYKQYLSEKYKPASVNSMLAALASFFNFCGCPQFKVKPIKIQRTMFSNPEREISREEYKRLLDAAKLRRNQRLGLVMQTICSTGIRVSELRYITVESVRTGRAEVLGKGKRRIVFLNVALRRALSLYIKEQDMSVGCIFKSRNGNPLNRHQIWADMKSLCNDAHVDQAKVFPHNLRHLFARTFYALEKDLGRLADILGHSNVNTTRIYTIECGKEHEKILNRLSLVFQ